MSAMQLLPLPSVPAKSESFAQAGNNSSRPTETQSSFQSVLERVEKESAHNTERGRARPRMNGGDASGRISEEKSDERTSVRGDEMGVGLAGAESTAVTVDTAEAGQDVLAEELVRAATSDAGRASAADAVAMNLTPGSATAHGPLSAELDSTMASVLDARSLLGPEFAGEPGQHGEIVTPAADMTAEVATEPLPPSAEGVRPGSDAVESLLKATQTGQASESVRTSQLDGEAVPSVRAGDAADAVAAGARGTAEDAMRAAAAAGSGERSGSAQGVFIAGEADADAEVAPSSDEGSGGQSVVSAAPGQQARNAGTGHGDARGDADGHTGADAGSDRTDGATFNAASNTAGSDVFAGGDMVGLQAPGAVDSAGDVAGGGVSDRSSLVSQLAEPLQELIETMTRERGPGQTEQVSIRLRPEFLGEVLLRVSVDPAGTVNARFVADNPLVRAMIEQDIGQLQATLDEHGLVLGEASVDAGSSSWADGDAGELPQGMSAYSESGGDDAPATAGVSGADEGHGGVVTSEDGTMTIDIRV